MIRHIVMWKFRPGTEEERDRFLSGLSGLNGVIPEIRHQEIHFSAVPDSDFDAVLISDFDSLEDLNRYKNDPRHAAVSALCKSIRTARSAVDVEITDGIGGTE